MMRWTGLLALWLLTGAATAPAPDRALAVGTVIPSKGENAVGGWRPLYRSTWPRRQQGDSAVTESQECCIAVFRKGAAFVAVRTEPVTRGARGEPLTERIAASKWITMKPGEIVADCQLLYVPAQVSLYQTRTHAVRSLAIDNGEFVVIEWRDPSSYCTFGD